MLWAPEASCSPSGGTVGWLRVLGLELGGGAAVCAHVGLVAEPRLAGNRRSSRRAPSELQRAFKWVCWKGQQSLHFTLKKNTLLFIY